MVAKLVSESLVNQRGEAGGFGSCLDDMRLRPMTDRVKRLYERLQRRMDRPQRLWGAGRTVLDDPNITDQPLVLRKAAAFRQSMLEMPIAIEDGDLIVGNSIVDDDVVRLVMPEYATDEERAQAEQEHKSISYSLAHKTPYYQDLLSLGLAGIRDDITARLDRTEDEETRSLLQAMRIEARAVIELAHRYADLAERQAALEANTDRRAELLRIAHVCRRVPEHPAAGLQEAIQSFWFVHYALSATHSQMSCGRIDQYLDPAFRADMERGTVTLEEAQELIDCLWIRFNDRAQIKRANFVQDERSTEASEHQASKHAGNRVGVVVGNAPHPWKAGHRLRSILASDRADAINHWGENILLSGIRPNGVDGSNGLTAMCLNAHEKFSFTSPVLTIRLHRDSPPELFRRVAEVLKEDGSGMPYIDNDDIIIKGYVDLRVPIEDARDYANSNCWETMIQGKSDQEMIRGINFLLLLELALHRGHSKVHGSMGPDTGDPRGFSGFRSLVDAWKAQADYLIRAGIDYVGANVRDGTLEHSGHGAHNRFPLLSALTLDCIEKGRDVTQRGARYVLWHVMGEAVANAIDALATIKRLVYDERQLSMDELLAAMDANWEGYEELRRMLTNRGTKFANDDDAADDIGRELMDFFVEAIHEYAAPWREWVIFPPSVGTFSWVASIGDEVAASADGRYDCEPVAANLSPAPGADTSGPIAAINSSLKMRVADLPAGAPMDLRMSKAALEGDAGTDRLAAMIRGFIDLGGNMLVLTITDVSELKRAMVEPENYRGLRVRMGGWSAYFCMLGHDAQMLHIKRVEHGLV